MDTVEIVMALLLSIIVNLILIHVIIRDATYAKNIKNDVESIKEILTQISEKQDIKNK